MGRVNLLIAVALCMAAGCKKENAPETQKVPPIMPSGFEKVAIGMSADEFQAAFPNAQKEDIPGNLRDADPPFHADPRMRVPVKDERFVSVVVSFLKAGEKKGRLYYVEFIVDGNKCSDAYLRGMAKALQDKTGETFKVEDKEWGLYAAHDFGTTGVYVAREPLGFGSAMRCVMGVLMKDWREQMKVTEKVKM